jgi:branched-chain amino acid transport system permease protein
LLTILAFAGIFAGLDVVFGRVVPDAALRELVLLAAVSTIVAGSLNVINGMAGQLNIGHAGFVGVGAYAGALAAVAAHQATGGGDPTFARSFVVVPAALVAAAIAAGAFGVLLGVPSLRLRGDYLAVVTLGFAEMFRLLVATARPGASFLSALGGQTGYAGPDPRGIPPYAGPFWIFGAAAVFGFVAWRLKFSAWGRALRAIREDEIAAASLGIDPTRYKVGSFVLSAAFAGVAGALLALMRDGTPVVYPDTFGFQLSFDAVVMVIVGGSGSVTGAMLGGVLVTLSTRAFEAVGSARAVRDLSHGVDANAARMILWAALLVVLMAFRPEGLLGERELFVRRPRRAPAPGA